MTTPDEQTQHEIIRLGKERYERDVKSVVESDPKNKGKMLAIDIHTSDYELADNILIAVGRLKARLPDAQPFAIRVGFPTAVRIGAGRYQGG